MPPHPPATRVYPSPRSRQEGFGEGYSPIALENIADARADVDGYIAAQRLAGSEAAAAKEIAERLVAAGRLEEALHWAERADVPALERGNIARLKVDILDRLGRTEDAQAVRWSIFVTSLSPDLAEYLDRVAEVAAGEARQRAIAAARGHPDVHRALPLLADLAPDIAADLVHRRLGEIQGEVYFVARPVADRLAQTLPVAAILLYRAMADAVLRNGQSLAYDYAVRIWSPPRGSSRTSRTGSGIYLRKPTASGSRPSIGRKGRSGRGWSGRDCHGEDDSPSLSHSVATKQREAFITSPLRVHSGNARARKASVMLSGDGRRLGSSPGKARARSRVRTMPGSIRLARTRVLLISPA